MKRILSEIYPYLEMILSLVPGFLGFKFRRVLYKKALKSCGTQFRIGAFSKILQPKNINTGDFVRFNDVALIVAND